jgi:hypothetical protein
MGQLTSVSVHQAEVGQEQWIAGHFHQSRAAVLGLAQPGDELLRPLFRPHFTLGRFRRESRFDDSVPVADKGLGLLASQWAQVQLEKLRAKSCGTAVARDAAGDHRDAVRMGSHRRLNPTRHLGAFVLIHDLVEPIEEQQQTAALKQAGTESVRHLQMRVVELVLDEGREALRDVFQRPER